MSYEPGSHQPPRFIVINSRTGESKNPTAADLRQVAQAFAEAHPGDFIDIYEHRTAMRSPAPEAANDGEPA